MQREGCWAALITALGVKLCRGSDSSLRFHLVTGRVWKGARFRRCSEFNFRSKFLWYRWVELSNESFRI